MRHEGRRVARCSALRPAIRLPLPDPNPLLAGTCPNQQNRRCLGRHTGRKQQWPRESLGPPCGAEVGWGGGRASEGSIFSVRQDCPRLGEPWCARRHAYSVAVRFSSMDGTKNRHYVEWCYYYFPRLVPSGYLLVIRSRRRRTRAVEDITDITLWQVGAGTRQQWWPMR